MIPDGNVLVALPAADALRIEANDVNGMRAEGDHAEETEPVSRRAADCPDLLRRADRLERRIRFGNGLQGFEPLQLFKDGVPGCRENGAGRPL